MGAFDDGPVDDGPVTNGHEPESEPDPEADRSRGPQPGGDPAEASGDGFEYVARAIFLGPAASRTSRSCPATTSATSS